MYKYHIWFLPTVMPIMCILLMSSQGTFENQSIKVLKNMNKFKSIKEDDKQAILSVCKVVDRKRNKTQTHERQITRK